MVVEPLDIDILLPLIGCSWGYNIALYPQLSTINSQVVEQSNSALKSSLSYMNPQNSHCKFFYGTSIKKEHNIGVILSYFVTTFTSFFRTDILPSARMRRRVTVVVLCVCVCVCVCLYIV